MKAIRIHSFGGPEQMKLEDLLRNGEILVRVRSAGVNPADWMIREKHYNPQGADRVPMILGQDFSGVIERIPRDLNTAWRVGDEVLGEAWGSFAEFVAVPVKDLVKKPKSMSFEMQTPFSWSLLLHGSRS